MEYGDVLRYYSREDVRKEVVEYCRGRWVALEGEERGGKRVFIRYWRDGRPLTAASVVELAKMFERYRGVHPRTVYGSVNVYRVVEKEEDLEKGENIAFTSPIWDIDGSLETWELVLEAGRVIVDFLSRHGVERSVFLKWSGEGLHVHIHERAFSRELLDKYHPLDVAYSIVEYSLRSCKPELLRIVEKSRGVVKVENEIDLKRVFTAPLSLHRKRDLACVCFKPDAMSLFSLEWADPWNPRHDGSWREFVEGEADKLALTAIQVVGGYGGWREVREKATRIAAEAPPVPRKIGRFQVMGLLQAARYYVLTGDLEKAKSFGLNRAIFYAWAKHHGGARAASLRGAPRAKKVELKEVCGEEVPVAEDGFFAMGGVVQTPRDYDRQVAFNISSAVPYEEAWKAAVEYVKKFPRGVLTDQQRFFKEVYEPVRDSFIEKVLKRGIRIPRQMTLDSLLSQSSSN